MSRRLLVFHLLFDFLSIVSACLIAYWLRFNVDFFPNRPVPDLFIYIRVGLFSSVVGLMCLQINQIYTGRRRRVTIDLVFGISKSMIFSFLLVVLFSYLFREMIVFNGQETTSRIIIGLSSLLSFLVMVIWRSVFFAFLRTIRNHGWSQTSVLLVGDAFEVRQIERQMRNDHSDYRIVGYCGLDGATNVPRLGSLNDVMSVVESHGVREVILAISDINSDDLLRLIRNCERVGVRFNMKPPPSTLLLLPADLHEINGVPLISPRRGLNYGVDLWVKRTLDVLLSILFITATLPVILLSAIAIRLDSPGPVIYRQKRIGAYKKPFWIYKFRSMHIDANDFPAPPGPLDRKPGHK